MKTIFAHKKIPEKSTKKTQLFNGFELKITRKMPKKKREIATE